MENKNSILALINSHISCKYSSDEIEEIRRVKVLKSNKFSFIKRFTIIKLIFMSNDWINLGEGYIEFYTLINIKKGTINLVGLMLEVEDNYRNEKLIFNKEINKIICFLLKNKYNLIWK
ncbi:hypothetical protein [Flavobacterium sp. U410]